MAADEDKLRKLTLGEIMKEDGDGSRNGDDKTPDNEKKPARTKNNRSKQKQRSAQPPS